LPLSYMCSVAKTTAAITAKNSSKRNPSKTQYCLVSPSVLISLSLSLSTVLLLPAWEFIMIYLYFGKPGVIKHQTVPNRLLN
jgi:flagellar biosynthesis protein FliP